MPIDGERLIIYIIGALFLNDTGIDNGSRAYQKHPMFAHIAQINGFDKNHHCAKIKVLDLTELKQKKLCPI